MPLLMIMTLFIGSFGSSATPSQKYGSRQNAGEVVCSFGACARVVWHREGAEMCAVTQYDQNSSLTDRFKYMFQKLADKAHGM